jgi:predicted DNA-binding ribbon-helix-helix protein
MPSQLSKRKPAWYHARLVIDGDDRLKNRNIGPQHKRSSMRLDGATWDCLRDIADRECITTNQLVARIAAEGPKQLNRTIQIRRWLMLYYRAAETERGHQRAGHRVRHTE